MQIIFSQNATLTVTTEKFLSSCFIFPVNGPPSPAISAQRRIFVINSIKETFISVRSLVKDIHNPLISRPVVEKT